MTNTFRHQRPQAHDELAAMLRDGRAPSLQLLLNLAPPVELEADYRERERKKYNEPTSGSPLSAWVRQLLITAMMHWSRDRLSRQPGERTPQPFAKWLIGYLDTEVGWAFQMGGGWAQAAQLLRIAAGHPRFPTTKQPRHR
ncbi:hypothetical protein OGR47_04525 [Methylocystis sp. MJC1]|jgi:hypothetical protein|uniref:hypothetical protein n=1 Tax=Methylocystis sp. MJC1 TaxID=2654282 RepID=UPI0013EA8744|nr:hypothetical protein [Methylocystis sp. MJC1]KAF2991180.1 hypothetical protein MJC1_01529 [Methylocystis sp. MJC1]MBU6526274.1 hypothetical protein [Methylocystis sp. MJC1]UZX12729.1 hypothetical protein OGR47_04525 [Methylocystis sp. MJC1]